MKKYQNLIKPVIFLLVILLIVLSLVSSLYYYDSISTNIYKNLSLFVGILFYCLIGILICVETKKRQLICAILICIILVPLKVLFFYVSISDTLLYLIKPLALLITTAIISINTH